MARKKETIKKMVVGQMKSLGTYKPEYRTTIDIYAGMIYDYEVFEEDFKKSGQQVQEEYTNKAGATNMRKTPVYAAMEKLRIDIGTYSNMLGLNPKALESITAETNKKSKLASVISELDSG
jgi:phage terminase small subunit